MQKAHVQPSLDLRSAGSLHLTCFLQAVDNHWQPQRWQYCTSQNSFTQTRKSVSILGYLSPASLRTPDHTQDILVTLLLQSKTRALIAVMPSC